MTQEEKAKRYDEALERAKKYKLKEDLIITQDLFPELKEKENERIRKDIIVLVKDWWDRVNKDNISAKEQMLAWLEKQSEQKFEQKFFINDKVVHKATGKIWTIHHYLKDTNSYYVEDNDGLLHHYIESELKLVEQKPAWSEENEKMIEDCDVDDVGTKARFTLEKERDWLRNKLKFFRPQNHWKPSEEQLDALWSATEKYLESDDENVRKLRGEILESLYVDLKKLREE